MADMLTPFLHRDGYHVHVDADLVVRTHIGTDGPVMALRGGDLLHLAPDPGERRCDVVRLPLRSRGPASAR